MPAKKARRISKQNKEILRRNYNKKLIQLNKLIYELSWYSSEINLQREFIQNFFNKQIDKSISIYRNQVKKLQDSSVDDYNFIVERTDRFYKRKYQKMVEFEDDGGSSIFTDVSLFEKDTMKEECENLKKIISDLIERINNEQEKYEFDIQKWMQIINDKVKTKEAKGQKLIDQYLSESAEKYNKYKMDFDKRIEFLLKNHDKEIENLKNEKLSLDFKFDSSQYQKINIGEYKNTLIDIKTQHLNKLNELKIQINNIIKDLKEKEDSHQLKYNKMEELVNNQINEMKKLINDLQNDSNSQKDQISSEISTLKSKFEQLKRNNEDILNEQNRLINQNSISSQSSLDYLFQSLQAKLELFQQKIDIEKQKRNSLFDLLSQQIEQCNSDLIDQISELTKELISQKIQNKKEIESYQEKFFFEKEKMLNLYKEELENEKNRILLLKSNKDQAQNEYNSTLMYLQKEKDLLLSEHQKSLVDFDDETEKIINQIIDDRNLNVKTLQSQINEMRSQDDIYFSNQIAEVLKQNQEKIDFFKKQMEIEYQLKIESLTNSFNSNNEFEKLEKSYQKEYEFLQNKLNETNVIIPESEIFKNMARVISDLQSEFKDHEVIIQSRQRCLNFEWQEKIKKENERFARSPFNPNFSVNPRARDQVKRSIQARIEETRKEKNEILSKLNEPLNKFERKSENDDVEIKMLKVELNQMDQQKIAGVQEAILKKEEMIKNTKEQIDKIQCQFGHEKCDLLNKINDQKTEFNSTYKKLNNSLLSAQIEYEQAEQNENNSFQSNSNSINLLFCEKKGQLIGEINELNDKSPPVSLSSSISSSSSSSSSSSNSLITQETREAWTKQRMDFDAKVQCLRDQLSSEISKLNQQKEEISRNLDSIWKEKLDRKMKLSKIMSNWQPRSTEADVIAKLEANLKAVTLQLNNATNELKKYKNICIDQEKQISKKFGGVPDVILLQ